MGTVRILYRAGTISLQAAVHPKYTLGALNMKEEEEKETGIDLFVFRIVKLCHLPNTHLCVLYLSFT